MKISVWFFVLLVVPVVRNLLCGSRNGILNELGFILDTESKANENQNRTNEASSSSTGVVEGEGVKPMLVPTSTLKLRDESSVLAHSQQLRRQQQQQQQQQHGQTSSSASELNTTLVIVIGNLRGGEATWRTMYEHLLDINSADLALVIGASKHSNNNNEDDDARNSSMYGRAKYIYEFPEYEEWADAVDTIENSSDWRTSLLPFNSPESGAFGPVLNRTGSAVINWMAKYWVQQHLLSQPQVRDQYDRYVVTRSDHYYCGPNDLSLLDNNYIWIPKGEAYFHGLCDRHLIANASTIHAALDILPQLVRNPEAYRHRGKFRFATPERQMKNVWAGTGLLSDVRLFDRTMFLTQQLGIDETRGASGDPSIANATLGRIGLAAKYPFEYEGAMCNCFTNYTYQYYGDQYRGYCDNQENDQPNKQQRRRQRRR